MGLIEDIIAAGTRFGGALLGINAANEQDELARQVIEENKQRAETIRSGQRSLRNRTSARERRIQTILNSGVRDLKDSIRFNLFKDVGLSRENTAANLADLDRLTASLGAAGQQRLRNVTGGFRDLREEALANLAGLGEQERVDINRRFTEKESALLADLSSRGLISSSVAPALALATERERSGSLGNLREKLARERTDVLSTFGLPELAARERISGQNQAILENLGLLRTDVGAQGRSQIFGLKTGAADRLLGLDAAQIEAEADRIRQNINTDILLTGNENAFEQSIINRPPDFSNSLSLIEAAGRNTVEDPKGPSLAEQLLPGVIQSAGTVAGAAILASDRRLKQNVRGLDDALDTLLKLRGVTFEYADPKAIGESDGTHRGFIAQEVEAVVPEWVVDAAVPMEIDHDGDPVPKMKMLFMRGFEAVVVEAMRELAGRNDRLGQELAEMRNRMKQWEADDGD